MQNHEGFSGDIFIDLLSTLNRRGPDNMSFHFTDGFYFGHTRLSILDVTNNGNQPMISSCGRYIIIYNGEIYNHIALRNKLVYNFKSTSDTETIIEYFARFGLKNLLNNIDGMFSFAIFDKIEKKFSIARDRTGEKPLYYGYINNNFFVSSSLDFIKSKSLNYRPEISTEVVSSYLTYSYPRGSDSIYRNTYQLLPGHSCVYNSTSNKLLVKQYFNYNIIRKSNISFDNEFKNLHQILRDSVKDCLISDRKIGTFLSGGIDSSLITALAVEATGSDLLAFNIGYTESDYSELEYAESVARELGIKINSKIFKPENFISQVENSIKSFDTPFADFSMVPTSFLADHASDFVTVALSGDGGDELFAGYNRHALATKLRLFNKIPRIFRMNLSRILLKVRPHIFDRLLGSSLNIDSPGIKIHKFLKSLCYNSEYDLYDSLLKHGCRDDRDSFYYELKEIWNDDDSFLDNMLVCDSRGYLPFDILKKVDSCTMHYSLECRSPFLTRKVLEYSMNLDSSCKIKRKLSKLPLRKILSQYIPQNLINRPKMGFGFPLDIWMRTSLKDWSYDVLFKEKNNILFKYVPHELCLRYWSDHQCGYNRFSELWVLMVLSLWFRKSI